MLLSFHLFRKKYDDIALLELAAPVEYKKVVRPGKFFFQSLLNY